MAKKKNFVPKPIYPGGNQAMNRFIKQHIKYPASAVEAKLEGTIRVDYSLDQSGRVVKASAVDGPKHAAMRREAERVVKLLKFEVPKERKMRIQYHQHLDIHFRLPKAKAKAKNKQQAATPTRIQYSIAPAAPGDAEPKPDLPPSSGGYSYTIKW